MKKIIFFLISLNIAIPLFANDSIVSIADSLYLQKEYYSAIKLYEDAIEKSGASSDIYYNLGNAYYRSDNLGKAILNYERALRLNPGNDDAKFNLDFVKTKCIDKIPDNRNFITRLVDSIINLFSPNTWAYLSIIILALVITSIALYMYAKNIKVRKIGFFGGIVLAFMWFIMIGASIVSAINASDKSNAIIMDESTMLSVGPHSPQNHAEEAILLHEGTKVEILDSVQSQNETESTLWYEVEINGSRAWINSLSVERI